MRVVNVNCIIDTSLGGGTAERTLKMSRALTKKGHNVTVLSNKIGSSCPEAGTDAFDILLIPCINQRFFIPIISRSLLKQISQVIKNADVVHIMSHWALINVLAYLICKYHGKDYYLCPAGALGIYGRSKVLKHIFNLVVGNRILRNAKCIIAITSKEAESFIASGISKKRVIILPNGVDADDFRIETNDFVNKFDLPDKKLILFIGRLNKIKGPDLLLKAFASIAEDFGNYHLVFAGPDQGMKDDMDSFIKSKGIQNHVTFVGNLDASDRVKAYDACEFMVIPSRQEAMSIVVLEAGITGAPVVMTDVCGFDDLEKIKGGYIVPANVSGIRDGLLLAIGCSDLKEMGQNLRKHVRNNYSWDFLIDRFINISV